jgi:tetratricopeptide (TPR) repeat protein
MIGAALLTVALAAVDPCAPVEPAGKLDPAAAEAYRKVGDAERAAGSQRTAAVAYRSALAHDPSDRAARKALNALCREGTGENDFQQGIHLMDAGDLRGAVAGFQRARAGGQDPSAALLEGICHYELGEDEQAKPLLREAEAAPVHRDAARFYLGLLALRRGETYEAASLLDSAAANPGLRDIALDMARYSRRSGKLVLSFLGEAGWDSNVILLPTGATAAGQASDSLAGFSGSVLYRPHGESGPYLRLSGLYRKQMQIGTLDFGGLSGAAGWQLGRASRHLVAEYDYDYRTLGGSPFLSAHRLLASGSLTIGSVLLSATYFARFESYQDSLNSSFSGVVRYSSFSGVVHNGDASILFPAGRALWIGLGYGVGHDAADVADYSWFQHGPRAQLRWQPGRALRFEVDAYVNFRPYDNLATYVINNVPDTVKRSDTFLDGLALAEYDLGDRWALRLSVEVLRALSNVSAFDFVKVVPVLGIAYTLGL